VEIPELNPLNTMTDYGEQLHRAGKQILPDRITTLPT